MNKLDISIDIKNKAIIFERITFHKFNFKIRKIKINDQEIYSNIAAISGYIKAAMNFNTFEFEFTDFMHINYLIKKFIAFVTDNIAFSVKYDELEDFLLFIDFIAMDQYFMNEIKNMIVILLMKDFYEFINYCEAPIINKIFRQTKSHYDFIKDQIKDNKCKTYCFNKFVDNKISEIKEECTCDFIISKYNYCYYRETFIEKVNNKLLSKNTNRFEFDEITQNPVVFNVIKKKYVIMKLLS